MIQGQGKNRFSGLGETNDQVLTYAVALGLQYMGIFPTSSNKYYMTELEYNFFADHVSNTIIPQLNAQYSTNLSVTDQTLVFALNKANVLLEEPQPTATNDQVLEWAVDGGLSTYGKPKSASTRTELTAVQWQGISDIAINSVPNMNAVYLTTLVITQAMIDANLNLRNYYKASATQPTATNQQVLGWAIDLALQTIVKPPTAQQKTYLTSAQWAELNNIIGVVVPQLNQQYGTNLVISQTSIDSNLHARNYYQAETQTITVSELVSLSVDAGLEWINKPASQSTRTELTTSQWNTMSHVAMDTADDINTQYGTNLVITQNMIDDELNSRNYFEIVVTPEPTPDVTNEIVLGWAVDSGLSWIGLSRIASAKTTLTTTQWTGLSDHIRSSAQTLDQQNGTTLGIPSQAMIDSVLNARNYFSETSDQEIPGTSLMDNKRLLTILFAGAFFLAIFPGQSKSVPEGEIVNA